MMIRALYDLAAWAAQPWLRRKLRRRGQAEPGYLHAVDERFGRYAVPRPDADAAAGRPLVWQPYPQHDDAHHAKLAAWLDWLQAPPGLRAFHRAWSGIGAEPLPPLDERAWIACASAARARLMRQRDLASQLIGFVAEKR